jgi:hypothetical protein
MHVKAPQELFDQAMSRTGLSVSERCDLLEQACAAFKEAGDAGGLVKCRLALSEAYFGDQAFEPSLDQARLAKTAAREAGDSAAEGVALFYETVALEMHIEMQDEEAPAGQIEAMFIEAVGKIDGARDPGAMVGALRSLAGLALAGGRLDEAGTWLEKMEAAIPHPASGWSNSLRRFQARLAERRGNEAAAIERLETLLEELSHFAGEGPIRMSEVALKDLQRLYRAIGQDEKANAAERKLQTYSW